ncbi:conserved hypothetical protein [Pyrenophora tritici-repentis Pt-1C-BFP]|uniref:Uncharacterized protein n=1 Tax=Pyrenophora tritici-repentis (strain Pt-1C-BFP) TaxID=426418 RepID=B2W4D7_PYRTR|nr:uncharacterized protein PTRG_04487 [Pyrenophora tritici-repentis Pt-1C-BFP]EDU47394.1 conserved hypothetical protein [Pyrenophora tritici-repentis Pt-1C-BFP]
MVYSWDDKEAICYRLYVEERRSLEEVICYWEIRGFTPSKQNPAYKNSALVARVRALWASNYTQKDMVDTLQAEGFQINDRELLRLRLRLKLLLRECGTRAKRTDGRVKKTKPKKKAKVMPGKGIVNQIGNAILADSSSEDGSDDDDENDEEPEATRPQDPDQSVEEARPIIPEPDTVGLSPEEVLRKQLRQQQLQAESDEKWRTRKRRRRTRGWAGLPADAPGEPPRFPSETTIDEAKAYLELDNNMYRQLRERFSDICREQDVAKKTLAGPEKWALIVQQLIRENVHLTTMFQEEPEVMQTYDALFRPRSQRALALDVICMDVTKRLRTMDTRMSLADAKNLLGLNPEQTRQVRSVFAEKLKAVHFTNKHEAGKVQWAELKQAWINDSEYLIKALADGEEHPDYAQKLKALDVMARDVIKRQQQEKTSKNPNKKKQIHQGPGPGPAPPIVAPHPTILKLRHTKGATREGIPQNTFTAPEPAPHTDLQIDPSLLLAASDAAIHPLSDYQPHHHYQDHHYRAAQPAPYSSAQPIVPQQQQQQYYPSLGTAVLPLPIYLRLHPHSSILFPVKTVWLSLLHTPSVVELRSLVTREHPGTHIHKLEGLIQYRGVGKDKDVYVKVTDDEELCAYLRHVVGEEGGGEVGGKPTFVALLAPGGGGSGEFCGGG